MFTRIAAKVLTVVPEKYAVMVSKGIVNLFINRYANIHVKGIEQLLNAQTPTIFVCNHLSNSDGLILSKTLKNIDPTFVAGVKLSNNNVTNIGMHVVKTTNIKPNSADLDGIRRVVKLVKEGESLLIFPEGTRSRAGSLIEAKKGILLIARMTGVPIVPIGIHGTEKLLPISKDGNMSSEKFQHADVYVNIGDQFDLPKKEKGQDKREYEDNTTDFLMRKIAELIPVDYQGVYKL